MVTPTLHSIQQPALPRSNLSKVLQDIALGDPGEDQVAYALLGQQLIDEFVHVRERVAP